jgi:hypothetical protein
LNQCEMDDGAEGKHPQQMASLHALLKQYNLIGESTCFLEFGAGKADLSEWISSRNKDKRLSFIAIDRKNFGKKVQFPLNII